jgi:hypothetical protein
MKTGAMKARIAAALAALSLLGAAAGPTLVGSVAALRNQVSVRPSAAPQARPATLGQRMALGDQVQTGNQSHMQLLLLDRSSFTVGPNARLTIDRFVYDPSGGSFAATVAKGALRFMSGGGHGKGGAQIRTPVATIGIRGTIVDAVVGEDAVDIARFEPALNGARDSDPATASLIVLRGPGPRDRRPGAISVTAGGKTVDLDRPLLALYVPGPNQLPIGPFTISLSGQAILNDLVLPRLSPRVDGAANPVPARGNTELYDPFPNRPYPPGYVPGGVNGGQGRNPGANPGGRVPGIPLQFPQGGMQGGGQGGGQPQGGGGNANPTGGPSTAPSPTPSPSSSPSPSPSPTSTGGPITGPAN